MSPSNLSVANYSHPNSHDHYTTPPPQSKKDKGRLVRHPHLLPPSPLAIPITIKRSHHLLLSRVRVILDTPSPPTYYYYDYYYYYYYYY